MPDANKPSIDIGVRSVMCHRTGRSKACGGLLGESVFFVNVDLGTAVYVIPLRGDILALQCEVPFTGASSAQEQRAQRVPAAWRGVERLSIDFLRFWGMPKISVLSSQGCRPDEAVLSTSNYQWSARAGFRSWCVTNQ